MLRIRLTRIGRTRQPKYRVVVAEHSAPIQGKFLEVLGTYNAISNPKEFTLDLAKYDYWCKQGAKPTRHVEDLAKKLRK
ncbi:MAG: 30S ribosomal protein S16 [Candidatus Gracilibacteria bacterium]|nr:30S ribosomal protein S16 [Candidatus Gracilibacteria bacterium]